MKNKSKWAALLVVLLLAALLTGCSLAREDGTAAFETARKYVRDFEAICNSEDDLRGLLLYGPVGTGKSFLAGCIGNALKAQGVPVLYVNVVTLTGLDFDEQREVIAHMGGARLLVLDDLGAERDTGFKVETLYNVLDRRHAAADRHHQRHAAGDAQRREHGLSPRVGARGPALPPGADGRRKLAAAQDDGGN